MLKDHSKPKTAKEIAKAGFTLIEIMVVVIILGLLAGFVAPKLMGRPEQARRTKAEIQITSLETALKLYKLDNGSYPPTLRDLAASSQPGSDDSDPSKAGYLEKGKVPKDPWGNDFIYRCPGSDNREYDIVSYGPDSAPGGERKNKDINSWEID